MMVRRTPRAAFRHHSPLFMSRASLRALALAASCSIVAACGDAPSGPEQAARDMARRFDRVADSLGQAGDYDAATSAQLMAEVLRMSNRLNTVTVSVDGQSRTFNALLLQYRMPAGTDGPTFGQVIVGWRGESLNEGFAFLLDTTGTHAVSAPTENADLPHVVGALFEGGVANGRAWLASSGSVTSPPATERGGCASSGAIPPTIDYECKLATLTFRATVTLQELDDSGSPPSGPSRSLSIDGQNIAGLSLTLHSLPSGMGEFKPRALFPLKF